LHSVYCGDHGVGKFHFALNFVTKMKDDNKIYTIIYPLADVDCKKDSAEVLKRTIISNLSESMNKVEPTLIKILQYRKGQMGMSCSQ
jgi:hypothetical protein